MFVNIAILTILSDLKPTCHLGQPVMLSKWLNYLMKGYMGQKSLA